MKNCSNLRPSIVLLLLLLPLGQWLRADTLTGEVRGVVLDVDGGVPLGGVAMTLINVDRGWEKKQSTDPSGNFAFIQLEPGNYTVIAENADYYRQEKTGVLIRLNQPKVVLPPFMLRKEVPTPTQQLVVQGEGGQTRTAVVDLTATGPNPVILAYLQEPGLTSLVSLLDWAIRSNFNSSLLEVLPLRGVRSFDQLAFLTPGVARVPFSGGDGPAVGIGVGQAGQFAVNGQRGRSNNFTVDGSDNNDEDIGVRRQGFVSLVPQSNESVQEFQITTAGFSAEFGRNSGSMVNAVSRSGTNSVHGQLYGLFGDDAVRARDFYEHDFRDTTNSGNLNGGAFEGDDFSQRILGGVIGGPIAADKLFYFASLESQREMGRRLGHFVVPTENERGLRVRRILEPGEPPVAEFIPIAELGNFLREGNFFYSSAAGEAVYSLYPLPNNPSGPFGVNTYSQVAPAEGDGLVLSGKLDWYLSPVHSLAGRYNFTDDDSIIPFTGDAFNSTLATDTRTQNVSLFLNSTTPQFGNALRVSYGRTNLGFPPDRGSPLLFGSAPVPPEQATNPGLNQTVETAYGSFGPFGVTGPLGQLEIAPYSRRGIDVFNFPQGRVDNTYQLSDFVTLTGTRHTWKVGFDFRRTELNSFSDRNSRPLLYFGNGRIADTSDSGCSPAVCIFGFEEPLLLGTDLAALGTPAGFLQTISTQASPDSSIGLRFTQYDFFVQHDWKVHDRLSLNLGLRYEIQSVPTERNSRIESTFNVQPEDFNRDPEGGDVNDRFDEAVRGLRDLLSGRNRIYSRDNDNFAPRVGFAWDPTGQGGFVVRGGFGLSYDAILGAVTSQSRNVFPTFIPFNLSPNGLSSPLFGRLVPSTVFLSLNGVPLIRPGTLNAFDQPPDVFATAVGFLFNQSVLVPGSDNVLQSRSVNGLAFTLPEPRPETPYAEHFLLSLQKQWGRDFLTTLDYVGTRGVHLTRSSTPNGGIQTTPVYLFTGAGSPLLLIRDMGRRPRLDVGAYNVFQNNASSTYHSLQASAQKRFSRNYEFGVNWTWSHAIDEVSDPFDSRGFFALPQNEMSFDSERGSANFDARHRVSFYLVWEVPGGGANRWLSDWKISALGEFQSGQPFTVNTSFDQNLDGNLTDRLDSTQGLIVDPGSPTPIRIGSGVDPLSLLAEFRQDGDVGRNTFGSDGFATVDLAVTRSFAIAEESRLNLRLELFNLFNTQQFGIPIRILESPGFGRTYDTQADSRSLRLAIRFSF